MKRRLIPGKSFKLEKDAKELENNHMKGKAFGERCAKRSTFIK